MTVDEALAILDKALLQKRLESDIGDVLQRLTTTKVELQGEVRVTAPEFIGASIIAPRLTQLLCEHPCLTIELLLGSPSSSLSERATDIALLFEFPLQSLKGDHF